jgi:hypothetical protein
VESQSTVTLLAVRLKEYVWGREAHQRKRYRTGGAEPIMHLDFEALNRYVLGVIGLFGVLLYIGLLYAGFIEFRSRWSKGNGNKENSRNRAATRRLRNPKASED